MDEKTTEVGKGKQVVDAPEIDIPQVKTLPQISINRLLDIGKMSPMVKLMPVAAV